MNHPIGSRRPHPQIRRNRSEGGSHEKIPPPAPVAHPPALVLGELLLATIAAGENTSCGLTIAGSLYCWGENTFGQVGTGDHVYRTTPFAPLGTDGYHWIDVDTGHHTCAVRADSELWCWGWNHYGQVGVPGEEYVIVPVAIAPVD